MLVLDDTHQSVGIACASRLALLTSSCLSSCQFLPSTALAYCGASWRAKSPVLFQAEKGHVSHQGVRFPTETTRFSTGRHDRLLFLARLRVRVCPTLVRSPTKRSGETMHTKRTFAPNLIHCFKNPSETANLWKTCENLPIPKQIPQDAETCPRPKPRTTWSRLSMGGPDVEHLCKREEAAWRYWDVRCPGSPCG